MAYTIIYFDPSFKKLLLSLLLIALLIIGIAFVSKKRRMATGVVILVLAGITALFGIYITNNYDIVINVVKTEKTVTVEQLRGEDCECDGDVLADDAPGY